MSKRDPKVPCKECAFSRAVEPGCLGGSEPEVYIGQSFAPFAIPCHCHCDFSDPDWKSKAGPGETPQCAGVAIFRANIGAKGVLPKALTYLDVNNDLVFSDPVQFLAHHKGISLKEAVDILLTPGTRISDLVREQISRHDNINFGSKADE